MGMEGPQNNTPQEEKEPNQVDWNSLPEAEKEKLRETAKRKYITLNEDINHLKGAEQPDEDKIKKLEEFAAKWAEIVAK